MDNKTAIETIQSLVICGMRSGKRQLFEALKVAIEALESAEPKWIPISEDNLPEDFQKVLITIKRYDGSRAVREAEYYENRTLGRKTFRVFANNERWEVGEEGLIAWMPKPEPCQETSKEDKEGKMDED